MTPFPVFAHVSIPIDISHLKRRYQTPLPICFLLSCPLSAPLNPQPQTQLHPKRLRRVGQLSTEAIVTRANAPILLTSLGIVRTGDIGDSPGWDGDEGSDGWQRPGRYHRIRRALYRRRDDTGCWGDEFASLGDRASPQRELSRADTDTETPVWLRLGGYFLAPADARFLHKGAFLTPPPFPPVSESCQHARPPCNARSPLTLPFSDHSPGISSAILTLAQTQILGSSLSLPLRPYMVPSLGIGLCLLITLIVCY